MARPDTSGGYRNGGDGDPEESGRSRREEARYSQYERFVSASRSFSAAMRASRIERQRLAEAREQALAREKEARAEAEKARERLSFLAEASRQLAESLDYETTLERVARLAVPRMADWCFVDLLADERTANRVAVAHASASAASGELARRMRAEYPLSPDSPHGTAKVLRTGWPEMIQDIDHGILESIAEGPEALEILTALKPRSCMSVPLRTRNRTLGAITLVSSTPSFYEEEDLALAEDLGRRAAVAIEHARLYREKSHTAQILQRSLLPPRLPQIPGFEVAAAYRPAGEGTEVGGDFYDVFNTVALGWALVMGDVCGKGPEAAELTALSRYTVRTAAMSQHKPKLILETLNKAILRQRSDNRFCTIAYALLNPTRSGARLDVCCGGHPPPLVLRADGSVETAGEPGLLLGVFPDPQLSNLRVNLYPEDTLVFYTDGATEARSPGGELFSEERLAELLSTCRGLDAQSTVEKIERSVRNYGDGLLRDDLALLALRVNPA